MDSKEIKLEVVTPSKEIGRCCICGTELATKVLTIERVQEIRFCDKCFNRFKDIINTQGGTQLRVAINLTKHNTDDEKQRLVFCGLKIDTTVDYDILLKKAKDRYKIYNDFFNSCMPQYKIENGELIGFPDDVKEAISTQYKEWKYWVKENVDCLGVSLHYGYLGEPDGITTVLAGTVSANSLN